MLRSQLAVFLLAASLTPCASAQALLKNIGAGRGSGGFYLASIDGAVLFKSHTLATGYEIWRTDGTTAGTTMYDLNRGSGSGIDTSNAISLGKEALFYGTDGNRWGLFATNGRAAGTRFVSVLTIGSQPARSIGQLFEDNGVIYIGATDAQGVPALFRTDGTTKGTRQVQHFRSYKRGISVHGFVNGRVLFSLDGTNNQELWSSDGTALGTRRLMNTPSSMIRLNWFAEVGKLTYFTLFRATPSPIWVTDGTAAGTKVATTLGNRHCRSVTAFGDALLVIANDTKGTHTLWRVDKSNPNGTLLTTLRTFAGSTAFQFAVAADDVAYVFDSIMRGHVPGYSAGWRTDGTASGTRQFLPHNSGITVSECLPVGNHLVFTGYDGKNGREPRITDGTAAGTRLLFDVWAGNGSANPMTYAIAADLPSGPRLYFSAEDPKHRREPRILPLSALAAAAVVPVREGCAAARPAPDLGRVAGQPSLGNRSFGLELRARPNTVAALLLDFGIGATVNSCATLFNPAVMVATRTGSTGAVRVPAPVPNNAALLGARVYAQTMAAAPGGAIFNVIDSGPIYAVILGR